MPLLLLVLLLLLLLLMINIVSSTGVVVCITIWTTCPCLILPKLNMLFEHCLSASRSFFACARFSKITF